MARGSLLTRGSSVADGRDCGESVEEFGGVDDKGSIGSMSERTPIAPMNVPFIAHANGRLGLRSYCKAVSGQSGNDFLT
ncbi:hypothetical protein RMSM_07671 [Rhodopirellula maiorica SM1]|uniref:Uncharacterized protein n=1 Tax=Rhodopirellula maiorica SM1 TaxID=1265738 RepID=M5RJ58_9BACT|nr:hypothetical protein RMSM_07671 [Rhodopirellula maiorica SM1]